MSSTLLSKSDRTDQRVINSLELAGFSEHGGWFYPTGSPDRAVVRIQVFDGHYEIWRRRKLKSCWMMVVSAPTSTFSEEAFNSWRNAWPLTQ